MEKFWICKVFLLLLLNHSAVYRGKKWNVIIYYSEENSPITVIPVTAIIYSFCVCVGGGFPQLSKISLRIPECSASFSVCWMCTSYQGELGFSSDTMHSQKHAPLCPILLSLQSKCTVTMVSSPGQEGCRTICNEPCGKTKPRSACSELRVVRSLWGCKSFQDYKAQGEKEISDFISCLFALG